MNAANNKAKNIPTKKPPSINKLEEQGKHLQGKSIVSPDDLPLEINTILVGLNPVHAKSIINNIKVFNNREFDYFYL